MLIIHYYKSTIDGVMTSLIDCFYNIRRALNVRALNVDVEFKIICPELYLLDIDDYYDIPLDKTQWYEYVNDTGLEVIPYDHKENLIKRGMRTFKNELTSSIPFLRHNRNFGDFNLLYSIEQKQKKFKDDIVLCSARLIYEILMGADIEIECNKLFVLDSLDTYKSKIGMFPDFDDLFDTMFKDSKVVQLSNPANIRESKYEQVEYYHKLSYRRLNALKQSNRIKDEYTFNRVEKIKTMIHDADVETYHFENMGKGIFEHLWFGRPVHYVTDGIFTKDGLYYYLKLFGIDAKKNQTIRRIPRPKIMDKLFYKTKDYLFKEIP